MKKLKQQLILALLALLIVLWSLISGGKSFYASFFLAPSGGVTEEEVVTLLKSDGAEVIQIPAEQFLDRDYLVETGSETGAALEFPGDSIVRLEPESSLSLRKSSADHSFSLHLANGRAWVNTLAASRKMYFSVHEVNIVPPVFAGSVFAVSATSDQATLIAVAQPSTYRLNSDADHSEIFLPPLQAVKFSFADLAPSFISESVALADFSQNRWFQENLTKDEQYRKRLIDRFLTGIDTRGLSMAEIDGFFFDVQKNLRNAENIFIFSEGKKDARAREFVMDVFDDGLYFLRTAAPIQAEKRFAFFSELAQSFHDDAEFFEALLDRFIAVQIFKPQDAALFALRTTTRDMLLKQIFSFSNLEEHVSQLSSALQSYLNDSFSAFSFDRTTTNQLLQSFFQQFLRAASSATSTAEFRLFFEQEMQFFSALSKLDSAFYRDAFFSQQEKIERIAFRLFPDLKEKMDASHQESLRQLRIFFFAESLSVEDARLITYRLGRDFSEQEEFLNFLYSEFPNSPTFGDTQKERFAAFQKAEKDRQEVSRLQLDLSLANPEEQKKVDDIAKEIQAVFAAEKFQGVVIGTIFDSAQRFIPIEKIVHNGIEFSGIYDRDTGLLSEIQIGDEVIFQNGVKLSQIPILLQPKEEETNPILSSEPSESTSGENSSLVARETASEKVAKIILSEKLKALEFAIEPSQIQTGNFVRKQFFIFGALLPHGKEKIFVNFKFDMEKQEASSVAVRTLKGPAEMKEVIPLDQLVQKIRDFYDVNFFEQVEKDLKK